MSMGYGGIAKKVSEDKTHVLYAYGDFNLNIPGLENKDHRCDGILLIAKKCFIGPEIHQKIKRMPSGKKKLVTKAIIRSVDVEAALHNGLIEIKNSSFAWNFYHGPEGQKIDIMARRTLEKLFEEYQRTGTIPEFTGWNA